MGYYSFPGSRIVRHTVSLAASVGILCGLNATAQAQDARVILQKVISTYQNLTSYEGRASVTNQIIYQGKPVEAVSQTSTMRYKKPNRLFLNISSPSGSRLVISDGTTLTVLDSKANQYTQGPSAKDMPGMLALLFGRAGIIAGMDPLYFISLNRLPGELGDLKTKGSGTYEGHPVFIISGVTRTKQQELKAANGQKVILPASVRSWTWYVDKQTYLLRKIEALTEGLKTRVPVRQGKKTVAKEIPVSNLSRHAIAESKPNAAIGDDQFVFKAPPGATPRKTLDELLKNK